MPKPSRKGYITGGRQFASRASYKKSKLFAKRSAAATKGWETHLRRKRSAAATKGWETRLRRKRIARAQKGQETRRRRKQLEQAGDPWVDIEGVRIYAKDFVLFFYHPFAEPRAVMADLEDRVSFAKQFPGYFVILIHEKEGKPPLFQPFFDPERAKDWNPAEHRRLHSGSTKTTRLQMEQPDLFDL